MRQSNFIKNTVNLVLSMTYSVLYDLCAMYSRACIDILLLQSSDNSLIVDIKLFYFERLTVLTHFIKIIRGYLCIIQSDTPTIFYHIL